MKQRNNFIKNLTLDLKGNTLVLFQRVESHGAILYEKINNNKRDGSIKYSLFMAEWILKKENLFVKLLREKIMLLL